MRRSTSTRAPLCSPARTMLMYKSEKTRGCLAMASDKLLPSDTSCRSWRLTSDGMPLVSRYVMLWSAVASGIPACSKFASCWVKVASSCIFGLRGCSKWARNVGGKNTVKSTFACARFSLTTGPPLEASTATGKSPSRSTCARAAARSATSRTPSTNSPLRRRARYENCGIASSI